MSSIVITALVSGLSFLLLVILCIAEARRGQRIILQRVRSWFDSLVLRVFYFVTHIKLHFGAGAVRIFFHYCIHRLLGAFLTVLGWLQTALRHLQQQNRTVATVVRKEQERTHLDVIAEHKVNVTLTEAEKERLKQRSLGE
ncbi:MAG: hypothetical protein R3B69_01995 [Candidatus Paceibacterota bacterium]